MKNSMKIELYLLILILCILIIRPILTSSLNNTDLAVINITLSSLVVFGTAIISFGIFGVLLIINY